MKMLFVSVLAGILLTGSVMGNEGASVVQTDRGIEKTVEWNFGSEDCPENFTPDASVEWTTKTDVSVEFLYSGELPDATEVTIFIPDGETSYQDEEQLYFYYREPDTNRCVLESESIFQNGKVTFDITHCSEFVITSEYRTEAYRDMMEGVEINVWTVMAFIALGLVVMVGKSVVKRKVFTNIANNDIM